MTEIEESKIRRLAYELWERDGSPFGRDNEYWLAALETLTSENKQSIPQAAPRKPRQKPRRKSEIISAGVRNMGEALR